MTLRDDTTYEALPGETDEGVDAAPDVHTSDRDANDRDANAIPLPEVTRRGSARRHRAQRRRHRRRLVLRGAAAATAVVVLVGLVAVLWPEGNDSDAPETAGGDPAAAATTAPPVLLAQQDSAGDAVSLTLIVPAAKNKGGALVLIPPGTMTEVVGLGLEPVGKSLGLGGPQRLDGTVENLLGVTIGEAVVVDDARLTALVQPVGALSIRVPERVEEVDPKGMVNVLYEAGLHRIEPQDVPRFLAARAQSNDLARLARHQAFWDAWLAKLRDNRAAVPKDPPALHKAMTALLGGDADELVTRVLPVQSLGTGETGELYQVDTDEVRALVGTLFPGRKPGASERPRLQILNGTGAIGLAQQVADRLSGEGVEVKLTGNAGRLDYTETHIVFYRRGDEAVAQRIQKALGVGRVVMSRNPLDVVDVTIIVGRDFKA